MPAMPKLMGGRARIDADALAAQYDVDAGPGTRTGTMHRGDGPAPTGVGSKTLTVTYHSGKSLDIKATSSDKVKYQAIKDHYKKTHNGQKLPFEARIALRPKPGTVIDASRIGAMHDALAGKGDLRLQDHVKQPKADALVSDKRYVEQKDGKKDKALGSGAFNTVYARRFKATRTSSLKAFFGIGRVKTRVVKESGPLLMNLNTPNPVGHPHAKQTGIDVMKPRVADRNVAARTSDEHLGLDIAPKAAAGMFDGKPCLAMKLAPGRTCVEEYVDHPEMILDPEFQHQMSDTEVSAFASGHTDPHMANVMVHRAEKKSLIGGETKITYKMTLVDNDTCHSPMLDNPDKPPLSNHAFPIQFRSTGLPAYMDAATAQKVRKLDLAAYAKDLKKNLEDDEVKSSCNRMQLLKNHVDFLRSENRIIKDWKAFTNEAGKPCAGGSVIEGTLAMPGVQQGFERDGAPHIVPRSMFLRDVWDAERHKVDREDANGQKAKVSPDFKTAVGAELYDKIRSFDHQDPKLMPPSCDASQDRRMEVAFARPTSTAQSVHSASNPETAEESQADAYSLYAPDDGARLSGTAQDLRPPSERGSAEEGQTIVYTDVLDASPEPSEGTAPYGVAIPSDVLEGRDRSDATAEPPEVRGYDLTPNSGSDVSAPRQRVDARDDMLFEIQAQRDAFRMI